MADARRPLTARRVLGGSIVLLTVAWFVGALVPAAQGWMVDVAAGFLLTLVTLAALWWTAAGKGRMWRFWRLIALAWTLNLLGTVAWGVYEMVTGVSLGIFSWIDGFYLLRYGVILAAFAGALRPWKARDWALLAAVTLLLGAGVWFGLYRPLRPTFDQPLRYFLGGVLYPILDAALLFAALWTWRALERPTGRRSVALFALGLLSYGIANVLNFQARATDLDAASLLAGIGWLLADAFSGGAALLARSAPAEAEVPSQGEER
ncbi:MAG: hypothetical protein ACP5HM_05155 [Anaerolineae bacterium]